jgi:hypothetical protein
MATKKSPINIKPSNKGKFTQKAKAAGMSVQALAKKATQKGSKVSPATKKQAVFAKNAAKWKKK